MAQRQKLPRSIVVLNIIMIVIVLAICAITVSLVYSPAILGEESSAGEEESVLEEQETRESDNSAADTSVTTTTATTTSVSMTKATKDEPNDTEPQTTTTQPDEEDISPVTSYKYDKSFYENDLFIGDSITTGIHLYNKLDMKNVAASVGYTPYKAYTEECDLYDGTSATALDYAKSMQPTRIFIMLGSNGLLSAGAMEDSYNTLLDKLSEACPMAELYCISVTPVAQYSDYDITMDMVNEFNSFIKATCREKDITYIDFCSEMTAADGYADTSLVANDGLHFNGSTYDYMLSYIQNLIG